MGLIAPWEGAVLRVDTGHPIAELLACSVFFVLSCKFLYFLFVMYVHVFFKFLLCLCIVWHGHGCTSAVTDTVVHYAH